MLRAYVPVQKSIEESINFFCELVGQHIEKWLRKKKSSPLTNKPMGTRLADHGDGRCIVSSAIENGLVDADAAAAWHLGSARLKIVAALPGGLESAKEHLAAAAPSPESERAEEASPEREALLEAFELRDRMLALVKRGDRLGLGREFERHRRPSLRRRC